MNETEAVIKLSSVPAQFAAVEYMVILAMLVMSVLIGVYFTFWSPQNSFSDYILGGRNMGVFPVAMSQVASHISGIALIGHPAEIYSYGTLYSVVLITEWIIPVINISVFLPIFYNLRLNSVYEYLELRFDHSTRVLGSLIFTISQLVYVPAYIYVPALVLNQVSGQSVQLAATIILAVCILYTAFGGIKAVLWTDTLQNLFSLAAVLFILYLGIIQQGGVNQIFHATQEGGRMEFFNMEISPFVRNSFWTMFVGNIGNWLSLMAVHPGAVQKCLSVPTLSKAKRVLVWTAFGVFLVHALTILMGMILYSRYHGCDPIATGEIKKTGQLLPLYVMEVTRDYPGLAGLFVSGVLSAALSSISSAINTMAGTFYEDIVEFVFRGKKPSDATQSLIMKVISLILGVICVSLVFLVDKTDSIFQIGMSLSGVTNGALLTLFLMGIFIPRANAKGAIAGSLSSLVVMAWVIGKAQYYFTTGMLKYSGKHTSVDSCPQNYSTDPDVLSRLETYRGYSSPVVADPSVPLLYQVSYMYYTLFGTILGLTVGMIVSLLTEPPKLSALDRQLFTTYVHHLLPRSPSKTHSVTFAEEEFKLIKYNTVPNEEVTTNAQVPVEKENTPDTEVVPRKEDIHKPE